MAIVAMINSNFRCLLSEGRIEARKERRMFPKIIKLTRISSTELQRTGSVRSSSAFSNQLLKADAFLANNRNKSSTLDKTENELVSGNAVTKTKRFVCAQLIYLGLKLQASNHLLVLILCMLESFFTSPGVFQQLLPPKVGNKTSNFI